MRQHENRVSAAAGAAGVNGIWFFFRLVCERGLRQREAAASTPNEDA